MVYDSCDMIYIMCNSSKKTNRERRKTNMLKTVAWSSVHFFRLTLLLKHLLIAFPDSVLFGRHLLAHHILILYYVPLLPCSNTLKLSDSLNVFCPQPYSEAAQPTLLRLCLFILKTINNFMHLFLVYQKTTTTTICNADCGCNITV